jgi:hypothetical protein
MFRLDPLRRQEAVNGSRTPGGIVTAIDDLPLRIGLLLWPRLSCLALRLPHELEAWRQGSGVHLPTFSTSPPLSRGLASSSESFTSLP